MMRNGGPRGGWGQAYMSGANEQTYHSSVLDGICNFGLRQR